MNTVSIGISKFKHLTYAHLKELRDVLLVEEYPNKPIAVVVPYAYYLEMQSIIISAAEKVND